MSRCIAIVTDMIFATRIRATAEQVGAKCDIIRDVVSLESALASVKNATVLVDMNCEGICPNEAIRIAKSHTGSRVIAFLSHVQTEHKKQAADAGADQILPRSTFVERLPTILSEVVEPPQS